jgi:molecular chaperone HtpG
MDMYRSDYEAGVKLYVKRVFITDDSKELLPVYLRFVKGIIDSEDLPLNVSRELLQENRILANIKQNSTKKILQTIKKFNSEEMETFTSQYNRMIKEGIYTDMVNRDLLLDIVRYKSSSEDGLVSFEEYVSRADSEKKEIYYIVGENEKILRNSPLLEAYKKANIEVLIMDDKEVDELVAPMIGEYGEWSLSDITVIDAPDSKTKEEQEEISKEFKPLTDKIKAVLGDEVKEVKISTRLTTSPSCVLKDTSDPMASMAALFAQIGQSMPEIKLVLEINPEHEMIKKLDGLCDESLFADIAWILLDSAKLSEGLEPKDKGEFVARITSLATKAL